MGKQLIKIRNNIINYISYSKLSNLMYKKFFTYY